ncbi:MAG: amidohydrolase [Deltaproteobacteria bacterium]|jgi:predicted amidohydrolase YtcJ|nr:amidohydrolase [Deltaproteobacteria bacterium]
MDELHDERIFYNGVIHTADAALPAASVLAVKDGRIVYAGRSRKDGSALLGRGAEQVDLGGRAVLPGLIDSHQHFMLQGQRLSEIDILLRPKEEILRLVAREAGRLRPGEWLLGRGWNHEVWPDGQWPDKTELDKAAPDNPVALTRLDGHSVWVNSRALREAGFDRNTPDIPGGEIVRDPDGEPRGILVDAASFKLRNVIPPLDRASRQRAFLLAQAEMFRHGITSVGDAWQFPDDQALLRDLYAAGEMRIRMYGMLASRTEGRHLTRVEAVPARDLFGGRLSFAAFKIVLDGSLGSRSAWLTEDYADRPGHRGNHRYDDEELLEVARSAVAGGFQLCLHGIGDAAVLQALDVLERLRREGAGTWLPHRIEHFQIAAPEAAARAVALGVIPAMQTIHAAADRAMAEKRLNPKLFRYAYPWRPVLDSGGILANGSDSPMDGVNPFHGFHAAITRPPTLSGGAPPARAGMTREETLQSYTTWAARAEMAEGFKGSLAPGKAADFIVLDRDIMACPEDAIRDARVLTTVLAGETVYGGTEYAGAVYGGPVDGETPESSPLSGSAFSGDRP